MAKLSLQLQAVQAAEGNLEVNLLRQLLSEVRSPRIGIGFSSATSPRRRRPTVPIRDNSELGEFLIGTTRRKRNDVEHVIFDRGNIIWNNHAGHPKWRKNAFMFGEGLGEMTIVWSVDDLHAPYEFTEDFSEFIENRNPNEGMWRLVATEPHTPSWGI